MKITIAIIFGGKSAEHDISLNSASNIYNAIDTNKFDLILLGIDRNGNWKYNPTYPSIHINLSKQSYFNYANAVLIDIVEGKTSIIEKKSGKVSGTFDVAFSIIHGNTGEDGTLQGFFKFLNIPFVGPDVLGSAVCMDKDITKRLLRDAQIPIADFICLKKSDKAKVSYEAAKEKLGLPLFVKPSNAGSSVGVSKVTDKSSFESALETAFKFDNKILIEEAIIGKEVECAILGNEDPKPSIIGEIIPTKDFYSYEAKYEDAEGAKMKIPADIATEVSNELRDTAVKAFIAAGCEGLARVDFFLKEDNTYVLNEINTLPGFTEISMYPKLWEQTGINYSNLITKLIELALDRWKRDGALMTVK
jgi:D-alanine-D-alanine ligase